MVRREGVEPPTLRFEERIVPPPSKTGSYALDVSGSGIARSQAAPPRSLEHPTSLYVTGILGGEVPCEVFRDPAPRPSLGDRFMPLQERSIYPEGVVITWVVRVKLSERRRGIEPAPR